MERNRRILVVDDQQDLCDQLAKLLVRSGKKNETLSLVQQMRARLLGGSQQITEAEENVSELPQYVVDIATQGEAAYEMVKKAVEEGNPYAVIFLDMRMPPGWDGLKTAKTIREADKNVEIVIMTAYADHDQKQIADTVGTPEKLLYIKKPFQAEEIYQLALSLTSKWSLEYSERQRKKWLEVLLKGMCKVKSHSISDKSAIYMSVLKSYIEFTGAARGFIISWNEKAGKWVIEAILDMEHSEAQKVTDEKSSYIYESKTIQHCEGKYLLPMKKDSFFAVAILYDDKAHADPEWYKLLCLFVMTTTEILSNTVSIQTLIENEKQAAVAEYIKKQAEAKK